LEYFLGPPRGFSASAAGAAAFLGAAVTVLNSSMLKTFLDLSTEGAATTAGAVTRAVVLAAAAALKLVPSVNLRSVMGATYNTGVELQTTQQTGEKELE